MAAPAQDNTQTSAPSQGKGPSQNNQNYDQGRQYQPVGANNGPMGQNPVQYPQGNDRFNNMGQQQNRNYGPQSGKGPQRNQPNNPMQPQQPNTYLPQVLPQQPGQVPVQGGRSPEQMQQLQMQMMNPQELQNYKQYGDPYYGQSQKTMTPAEMAMSGLSQPQPMPPGGGYPPMQPFTPRPYPGQGNDMAIAPPYNPNAGIEQFQAQPQTYPPQIRNQGPGSMPRPGDGGMGVMPNFDKGDMKRMEQDRERMMRMQQRQGPMPARPMPSNMAPQGLMGLQNMLYGR